MKIVFFGGRHTTNFVEPLLTNFELQLVISTDEALIDTAVKEKIPHARVISIDNKLIDGIKKIKPDLGVVADFGLILPKKLLDIFPKGMINVHPSLLPKYRGPTPVQSAILNGDLRTGYTIIKIDEKVDHGPILYQEGHALKKEDFSESAYAHLFGASALKLPEVIKNYTKGKIKLSEQDHNRATFTKMFKKEDGYFEFKNPPKKEILKRVINAFYPWPGVFTHFRLSSGGQAKVVKLLPQDHIQVEGKRPMNYKDFKNGYENGEKFLRKLNLISN